MRHKMFAAFFFTLLVSLAQAYAAPSTSDVLKVQRRTQDVFLSMAGVKYVGTGLCEEGSGDLVTGFPFTAPLMDCVAIRVKQASDLAAIEAVYPNPLVIDGVTFHFTLKDPIPNKGGITVHN